MRYTGVGVVLKEGEPVAEVEYDLVRTIHYVTLSPNERREGLSEIHGEVTVVKGAIELGQQMLLRMQNGRIVSFFAKNHSNISCLRYSVVVSGDPGP